MYSPISAIDTTPVSITARALNQNFTLEEKDRREQAQKNKDFYYGKQEQDLVLANEDVDPVILNLTRPILHKRTNMLYSRPLVRDFIGPSASIKFLEQVYQENAIDALLQKVDLLAELTGSCLIHPMMDESFATKIRLVLYDAASFTATGSDNDPTTADALSLLRIVDHVTNLNAANNGTGQQPQVERLIEQQIWTPTTVSYYSGPTNSPILINSVTHDLGFLPFVNFKGEEVHDQYIGFPNATNVTKMNRQINQMLTNLAYMIKMQAFTPIVASGYNKGDSITWHPGKVMAVPSGAVVNALDISPKIMESLEAIQWFEDRLYVASSVPKISVEGGDGATSGRELLIRWFPLMQVFQEKCVRYQRYELQLANMILALNNMPPIEDVMINFPEETILPFSPEDENLERDLKLNLTNVVDELIKRNPQLDETEATKIYEQNKTLNEDINNGSQETRATNSSTTDKTQGGI